MRRRFLICCLAFPLCLFLYSCRSTQEIRAIQATAPTYPRIAQLAHITGDIVVAVEITRDGKVSDAQVVSGMALREIRQVSLEAAKEWVFNSSSKDPRRYQITFSFTVAGEPNVEGEKVIFLPPDHISVTVHPIQLE